MEIETYHEEIYDRSIEELLFREADIAYAERLSLHEPVKHGHYMLTHRSAIEAAKQHDEKIAAILDYHIPVNGVSNHVGKLHDAYRCLRQHQDKVYHLCRREELLYRMYINPLLQKPWPSMRSNEIALFSYLIDKMPAPDLTLVRNPDKRSMGIDSYNLRLGRTMWDARYISLSKLKTYDSTSGQLVEIEVDGLPVDGINLPSVLFIELGAYVRISRSFPFIWERFVQAVDRIVVLDVPE